MASEASYPEEQSTKQNDSGVSWKQNEEYVVPKNRLGIVSVALMCTMFLAALDPVSQRVTSCPVGLMAVMGQLKDHRRHCASYHRLPSSGG